VFVIAHLDSESEADIQERLEMALRGRTSIVIARGLSTILKADLILVVQGGRSVEPGKHAELFEQLLLCGLTSTPIC
jgi:ATP-binding cassette, subfamily B, bacterial